MKLVTYLRVSTVRQGQSGLGLEAQRAAVDGYVAGRGEVVGEYVEVESGKNNDRPQLTAALATAKAAGATLLIAKLDRLGRNVHFISGLLEAGVEVCAADNPNANRMMMQMFAVFAEEEGRAISERTKAALAAAKARGVKLGWSKPERASEQRQAAKKGAAVNRARALTHADNVLPLIEQIRAGGASLRQIAAELNARGIKTARGGKWHAATVRNILMLSNRAEAHAA
jgi:DNA invertase Pin-like site-specific DNA recombinase